MRLAYWALAALLLTASGCYRETRADLRPRRGGQFLGEGWASYYGHGFHGRTTASGERFDQNRLTAAHRTLRFGSCVRVIHLETKRWVEVRINDRGPFVASRIIDLSEGAARELGIVNKGVAQVRLYSCDGDTS